MGIFSDIKFYITRLSEQSKDVKENLARVEDEARLAQHTGQQIQQKIEEFQFSTQGNLHEINKILNKYNQPSDQ